MKKQLTNYVNAGYPAINIVTYEERRAEAELAEVAHANQFGFFIWSLTKGIVDVSNPEQPLEFGDETRDPLGMLERFEKLPERSILVCRDFHQLLDTPDPLLIRRVKDALALAEQTNRVLVPIGCRFKLPPELEKEIVVVEFSLPDRDTLNQVLEGIAESAGKPINGGRESLLDAASGLTTIEAKNACALSVVEAGELTPTVIAREKAATIKKNGILEIIDAKVGIESIGGLDVMKGWLTRRRQSFGKKAKEYGLPVPKGILVVGIPGTGKSLSGKATAGIFGTPLLKLDCGRIFGSLVGESERNMRAVIQTAEAIAPCVLWVD